MPVADKNSFSEHESRSPSRSKSKSRSRSPHVSILFENPPPTRCLGVFGLSTYTTERDLHQFFSKWGVIEDVHLVYDHPRTVARLWNGRCRHGFRVDFSITKRPHTPTPGIYMGQFGEAFRRRVGGFHLVRSITAEMKTVLIEAREVISIW
ncbi:Splicing factor, arginine [Trichuris trichiura]|uniref:Splicing factor, arginine n=1 Tax=Trichuris trichiura TaxID=36087 RepID=A0A077Z089_TRITR|nr:Splicing factor, arginine [Trichuris trichiura]